MLTVVELNTVVHVLSSALPGALSPPQLPYLMVTWDLDLVFAVPGFMQ